MLTRCIPDRRRNFLRYILQETQKLTSTISACRSYSFTTRVWNLTSNLVQFWLNPENYLFQLAQSKNNAPKSCLITRMGCHRILNEQNPYAVYVIVDTTLLHHIFLLGPLLLIVHTGKIDIHAHAIGQGSTQNTWALFWSDPTVRVAERALK